MWNVMSENINSITRCFWVSSCVLADGTTLCVISLHLYAVFLQNTLQSYRSGVTAICEPSAKFPSTGVWRVWILKLFSLHLNTAHATRATWGPWAPLARFVTSDLWPIPVLRYDIIHTSLIFIPCYICSWRWVRWRWTVRSRLCVKASSARWSLRR